jgi:hypothetical protein
MPSRFARRLAGKHGSVTGTGFGLIMAGGMLIALTPIAWFMRRISWWFGDVERARERAADAHSSWSRAIWTMDAWLRAGGDAKVTGAAGTILVVIGSCLWLLGRFWA